MSEQRVSINLIIENQLPEFVKEEFPLVSEFLSSYYLSLETKGNTYDIIQNIDKYVKVDNLANLIDSTTLYSDVDLFDSTIEVTSTLGFPPKYGLIKVNDEIVTYTGITTNTFTGCIRGFSGVTSYDNSTNTDQLVFSTSNVSSHVSGTKVENLSILFLKKFFKKLKIQITPGFEDQEFYSELNESLFIKQSKDFYQSKGTEESFKILFRALYGEHVEVIKPSDFLIQPSDAQYRIYNNLVVESVEGDPQNLINSSLIQDGDEFFTSAEGTVTNVEKITRNGKIYYIISLDYDYNRDIGVRGTIQGKFSIHPRTILVSDIQSESTYLDVDSTIGFPNSGELLLELDNGGILNIQYQSKSLNQFFECSGISENISSGKEVVLNSYAYGYYGENRDQLIKVRITGVLQDLNILNKNETKLYNKNDKILIKTLGDDNKNIKANNWFFNISTNYEIKSAVKLDASTYSLELYDAHAFVVGDIVSVDGVSGRVSSILTKNSIAIIADENIDVNSIFSIKKKISKVNCINYPYLNIYNANVQNVYYDLNESFYVASPSLPSYLNEQILVQDGTITFSGSFDGEEIDLGQDHYFYTGDLVLYKPSNVNTAIISEGIYVVKRINASTIKLARSRENLFYNIFLNITGNINQDKISFFDYSDLDFNIKQLQSQKLIRKISNPINENKVYPTEPGSTGIFINGVELLNYKSKDKIFYGEIDNIIPISPGINYDIINPPTVSIADSIGSGAIAHCSVIGNLQRIDIVDPGFDYIEQPVITITGGNGVGASAEPNLVDFTHTISFNSSNPIYVDVNNDIIGFSTYHKLRNLEEVIYDPQGQSAVVGLVTNSTYIVSTVGVSSIKLYKSTEDAIIGINTISISSIGSGNHIFKCKNKKKKIGSISIKNSGYGYCNKKRICQPVGVNTASDIIYIKNHGYNDGEIIQYTSTGAQIQGLVSSKSYYLTKISDNEFKLSEVGISTDFNLQEFFYKTRQYVDLVSQGSGNHIFNYPAIQVNIKGRIGIQTYSGQDFNAVLTPIFRGKVDSVFLENGGTSYGSEEIVNYNRQPSVDLLTGSGAEIIPIVSPDGRIVDISIQSGGINYNSQPDLIVNGDGIGAVLTPIITNGSITEVKIISSGGGYSQNTTLIQVKSAGSGAKFESNIKYWTIDLVKRSVQSNRILSDDGFIYPASNPNFGLQYMHLYASTKLRSSVFCTKNIGSSTYFVPDIDNDNSIQNLYHSPIIGWCYDGNPIYGPYGYSSTNGASQVKSLVSGYKQKDSNILIQEGRPSFEIYPLGAFIEDYQFTSSGDLDENNGRFCITPEFPNGVYAYFCTLDESKSPKYPYVIGENYKSNPIQFNFSLNSNQDYIDFNSTGWIRNTTPYNLLNERSGYNYLFDSSKERTQVSLVSHILSGSVSSINLVNSGIDYQVNDEVIFDNEGTSGRYASSYVSKIKGKKVNQISIASTFFDNIEFIPSKISGTFLGFSTIPHNFNNNDIIVITSNYEYNKTATIKTSKNILNLSVGVGTTGSTGLVTYFSVSGNLNYPNIRENDLYQISGEVVKILNIDPKSSRVRVLRNHDGTAAISTYSAGIALTEKTRKFEFNIGIATNYYDYQLSKEIYFDPQESISKSVSGVSSTIYFSNPGVGITYISIPLKTIYLPNHNLKTGTKLLYSSNTGSPISVSTDTSTSFVLNDNSIVYVAKFSNDLIGISTVKVGLNSVGNFVSIGSTSGNILYFTDFGTKSYHSFKPIYDNSFKGEIVKNSVTVSTASSHGLSVGDEVDIQIKSGITTTVFVKYNDHNRRLIVNPKLIESVNITDSSIKISNHSYNTGDKVIYTSDSPIGGLISNKIYYIVSIGRNTIKLSETLYDSKDNPVKVIELTSIGTGYLSQINPPLKFINGQTIIFDLSDSSLSYTRNFVSPAFDFSLYSDSEYKNKFEFSGLSNTAEVTKTGIIGVDANAKLTINITDNIPKILYYKLTPINLDDNLEVKLQIIIDDEQYNNNAFIIGESLYSGNHTISEVSSNTFKYVVGNITPEANGYNKNTSSISYTTSSSSAYGEIYDFKLVNGGRDYIKLPKIKDIESKYGANSLTEVKTTNIGSINKVKIQDIGYNYSPDFTVRPKANLPKILKIDTPYIFDYIEVFSKGFNYINSPNLIVIDGITNNILEDVKLEYSIGENTVKIIENTNGISNVPPKIVPVNNSNGVGINSISFDEITKDVTISVKGTFISSTQFPFSVGDQILIENVITISGKGYDSENYGYEYFTIKSIGVNPGITTNPTITYNLSDYLIGDEVPGTYDNTYIDGSVVPIKYFPVFNPVLKKLGFLDNEFIESNSSTGIVENWDNNSYLSILSDDDFKVDNYILGKTSGTKAKILEIYESNNNFYNVSSSSIVEQGWNKETGFLNNNLQKIHDSDYYQYFSYSLKSKIQLDNWDEIVDNLNHTSGFKKFGDLLIESIPSNVSISSITENFSDQFLEIDTFVNTSCIPDFDFVREGYVRFASGYRSNQVYMQNVLLSDYIEMIGNRVIVIDDISLDFDNNKKSFDLTSNNTPIFEKKFVGSAISTTDNIISFGQHYFSTGEEIVYIPPIDGSPIGIATTNISGIGVTDILPSKLYIIKESDSAVRVSSSASEALKTIPIPLQITSVGSGTTHTFISKNQNTKLLITIDNIIQSPLIITNVSTTLGSNIGISTDIIPVSGITSFFPGNYIEIDQEIMRINSISNNQFSVIRNELGTISTSHTTGSLVKKIKGNYNVVDNTIHFAGIPIGDTPVESELPDELDFSGITINSSFSGRAFLRSGIIDSTVPTYFKNSIFDDISNQFDGLKEFFNLKLDSQNITDISDGKSIILINNVFQCPSGLNFNGDYALEETAGITSITFSGNSSLSEYDVNNASVPRGGIIVSVGSTSGFGYQPLVSAGGTAIISIGGTIQSISIGNSGSGYRSGLQTVNVGINTDGKYVKLVGIASVINGHVVGVAITNPGIGYTVSPEVVFDPPIPYSNIPLVYSSQSSGNGIQATADIIVGQGSSVISFEVKNFGYGYNTNEVLTIGIGGTVGIPTTNTGTFEEFKLTIERTYNDEFFGWYMGDLLVFDPLDRFFDSNRTNFIVRINNEPQTITSREGSNLDPNTAFLIFINDVLQIPEKDYVINGSFVTFTEAPKSGDKSRIVLYTGTSSVDIAQTDILETIKPGDGITLLGDDISYQQNERIVVDIRSADIVQTTTYVGPGISTDDSLLRPLTWCIQKEDKIIDGQQISKDRKLFDPSIYPITNIIADVGISTDVIYVESVKTFFDNYSEGPRYEVILQSQDPKVTAQATAILSGDTVSSIVISNPGIGYTEPPTISIGRPTENGVTATATVSISQGSVNNITVDTVGSGYTSVPEVIISSPKFDYELIKSVQYNGDFGIITGVQTTTYGGSNALVFDFYIPDNSYLKDIKITNPTISVSGISSGHYFVVSKSNTGTSPTSGIVTSKTIGGSIIGISSFIDNVYQVSSVSIGQTSVPGEGIVNVAKVIVKAEYSGLTGLGYSNFYGEYSWGTITDFIRPQPKAYNCYNLNGSVGISTSPVIFRYNPLKYENYT